MTKISRYIQAVFAVIFGLTILSVIARGYSKYAPWKITVVIISGVIFTAAMVWLYKVLRDKTRGMTTKKMDRIFICISVGVLILQIICAFALKFTPVNDLNYVDTAARAFCQTWDKADLYKGLPEYHMNYFVRYPNNQALLVIVSLIYWVTDNLFGTMPIMVPIMINTIGLYISYVLTYLIAKKIFTDKFTPLFCAIIGAGFTVFYAYVPNFYTDSMSMPFAMTAIYLFLCGIEKESLKSKISMLALSGLTLAIGYKIKGSIIILVPAFILYLILTGNKENRRSYLSITAVFAAAVIASTALCNGFIGSFNITDKKEREQIEFPTTHWVMMGLHDRGGYYENDFYATMNSGDYDHKVEFNLNEIKNRISQYGVMGMVKHIAKKVSYTWGDGTYFSTYYLKKTHGGNALKNFIAYSDGYKWYCSAFQCMLLIMLLFSFISGACAKEQGSELLLKLLVCGVYFFFIIWEARSRYLVNFSPIFIMLSAYEIRIFALRLKGFITQRKMIFRPNREKNISIGSKRLYRF